MTVYLDTSVVLHVLFGEPQPVPGWGRWTQAYASALWRVEALRTVDRACLNGAIDDGQVVQLRRHIDVAHGAVHVVPMTEGILLRAAESFATTLGTLDAIHLASALAVRDRPPHPRHTTIPRVLRGDRPRWRQRWISSVAIKLSGS